MLLVSRIKISNSVQIGFRLHLPHLQQHRPNLSPLLRLLLVQVYATAYSIGLLHFSRCNEPIFKIGKT